jgi:Polyketide cyclase / dehydrase and lipid transport
MGSVGTQLTFPGTVHEAETCWYEVDRWADWVDGLDRVVDVTGEWPREGATVTWESVPAGRGRVVERVVEFEQLREQTTEVRDASITGRQRVSFTPTADGVTVGLELDYKISNRSLLTPLVDFLFIKPAMRGSLRRSLERFGTVLGERRASSD